MTLNSDGDEDMVDENTVAEQTDNNENVNNNTHEDEEDIDIEEEHTEETHITATTEEDDEMNEEEQEQEQEQDEEQQDEDEEEEEEEEEDDDDDEDYVAEDEDEEEDEVEGVEEDESEESDEDSGSQAVQQQQFILQQQQQQEQQKPKEIFRMPEDYLIPIKLDVQTGIYRLSDSFLWNLNEESVTPEQYAKTLCTDIDFPEWFDEMVASSISNQINSHREIMRKLDEMLPNLGCERLVPIFLDLTVNGYNLKDQFDWDLFSSNSVEAFSRSLCLDLGLSREFENAISFAIREQIQFYFHQLTLNPTKFPVRPPVSLHQVIRNDMEVAVWTPTVQRQNVPIPFSSINHAQMQQPQPQMTRR